MSLQNPPAFPPEIEVYELPVVDYDGLVSGDPVQVESLWSAATNKGFWYLKSSSPPDVIESMFTVGKETLDLSLEEKMQFWQGDDGGSFGFKNLGATTVDLSGSKDNAEMINIAKDDVLAYPNVVHRTYPAPIATHMTDVVQPYISSCIDITKTILRIFEDKLALPEGTLAGLHSREEASVSEARYIKVPPTPGESKIAVGAHTDFGSLSLLINKLGGLQLLPEGSEIEWKYVKPRPGHFICNIGDALNLFSGGILKSSIHRVVSPPLSQSAYERSSLVFFTRPGNSVVLNALVDKSPAISAAVAAGPADKYQTGVTAAEWFARRQSKWRVSNQKGVGDYLASRGTEHTQTVV